MSSFQYHRPTTLEEALRLWAAHGGEARFVAGGTDVLPALRDRARRPPALVSLRRVRELDGIEPRDEAGARGATRIGGLTRVADVAEHEVVVACLPVLAQAATRLGSTQIRNMATVGGNLCNASPCADLAPALLVYDASVQLVGPRGRRDVPLEDFFVANRATRLEPGEILEAVLVPTPAPGTAGRFDKVVRVRMDIALVSLAAVLRVEAGRVACARFAMGSVAPRPIRLRAVEAHLGGRTPDLALARGAAAIAKEEVSPIDDLRATAAYRRHVASVLVERAVRDLAGAGGGGAA